MCGHMSVKRVAVLGPSGEIENVILIETDEITTEWVADALGADRSLADAEHIKPAKKSGAPETLSKVVLVDVPSEAAKDAKK